MRNMTLARRYAKALYELSNENKSLDDVLNGMNNIAMAIKAAPDLERVLLNPLVKPDEKSGLIKTITSNKMILKFVSLLAKRKRLDLLSGVHAQLTTLSDIAKGIHRVDVKTAITLSEAQKKGIEKDLAKSLGGSVMAKFDVARELIGGVWIKMGDKVLDATLKGRMDDLRHVLVNSTN